MLYSRQIALYMKCTCIHDQVSPNLSQATMAFSGWECKECVKIPLFVQI